MRIKMNCEVQEQQKHQSQQQQQQHGSSSNKLPVRKQESCSDDDESPSRTTERQNLEFAKKLGYSEQSIHSALTRLGSEAKQNELLAELIKLTADAPRPAHIVGGHPVSNCASNSPQSSSALRHIVIDGSNVALSHGNNLIFSCRGIRICVDWFRQRGHREITAFVPNWRKELANNNIADQEVLYELEHERFLVFTPSRHLDGKRVSCYDDRFILKLAVETDGIVVSNDNYRDLILESNEFRRVVQERLLMYSFVNDIFMPPDDPLGRSGPNLDLFLCSQTQQKMADAQQLCPYGKKCTYGQKCKFRHHNQGPLLQRLPLQASHSAPLHTNGGQQVISPGGNNNSTVKINSLISREPLGRTKSNTIEQVCQGFSAQMELTDGSMESSQPNRHKKLQRQQPPPAFRLLVPTYSAPLQQQQVHHQHQQSNSSSNYHHQYLTRTPSAPVTDQGLGLPLPAHNFAHLSASDSRINEELHASQQLPREEQRRLLRYHLGSLFPPHQVHAVLQLYPEETDAKAICAAILNLFPHN
ncbi:probable ribonuclease ZC3H12C [Drosophila ficusphila]|uniref:probable ribonuclease ZC3H12C n=1 Tax=Drosophila ficusphila TaxID=30025 RepID=UPI0007E862FC|nr:probable ribonuclease ZC3H12C [Drosophila ficusphila]